MQKGPNTHKIFLKLIVTGKKIICAVGNAKMYLRVFVVYYK